MTTIGATGQVFAGPRSDRPLVEVRRDAAGSRLHLRANISRRGVNVATAVGMAPIDFGEGEFYTLKMRDERPLPHRRGGNESFAYNF
jgi:hypothetical protein